MPDLWFLVIGIVVPLLLTVVAILAGQWMKLKEKQLDHAAVLAADKAAAQTAQVERLEQRMRVLERIVTDKGADLSAQIEDLRDERIN